MTADVDPIIHIAALSKTYTALRPLRVAELSVGRRDRIVLSGFDELAAEMFVYLVTGASLPDEGHVRVAGRDTRDIATDTEWLSSLDRFGIVTHRAVLLEGLSVAANLALPLTLSIDPMADDVRERVRRDAIEAGLPVERVDGPVAALTEGERLRVHLARAAAVGPDLIMLEHPTRRLDQAGQSAAFGATLQTLSTSRGFGWIAISEDESFAKASGGTRLRLDPATGRIKGSSWLRKLWV
jgi:predicted ABC-type transport system involved in lysophospholipase L1 biosynthesis ATPase subunit